MLHLFIYLLYYAASLAEWSACPANDYEIVGSISGT